MDDRAYEYLKNQRINIFNGVLDADPKHDTKLITVLDAIRDGKWKTEVEWFRQETDESEREAVKKQFPAVTFSGTFNKKRRADDVKKYTNILVVDLDKKDFPMSFEKMMDCLKSCHFIFAAFESPSGGIKALAYSKLKVTQHKEVFFIGVEEYLRDNYGMKMDPSGKDISRLCFISYDPNLYLSPEGKRPFNLQEDAPKTFWDLTNSFQQVSNIDYSKYEESHNIEWIMQWAKKWARDKTGGFVPGSRNNYIFYLSCILNRAGVHQELTDDLLNKNYPSLGKKEISSAVKSAYTHNKHEFGTRPIMQHNKNQQIKLIDDEEEDS